MQVFVIMGGVVLQLVGHLMGLLSSKCPIQIYFIRRSAGRSERGGVFYPSDFSQLK